MPVTGNAVKFIKKLLIGGSTGGSLLPCDSFFVSQPLINNPNARIPTNTGKILSDFNICIIALLLNNHWIILRQLKLINLTAIDDKFNI